jgi:hypothetical protein
MAVYLTRSQKFTYRIERVKNEMVIRMKITSCISHNLG